MAKKTAKTKKPAKRKAPKLDASQNALRIVELATGGSLAGKARNGSK